MVNVLDLQLASRFSDHFSTIESAFVAYSNQTKKGQPYSQFGTRINLLENSWLDFNSAVWALVKKRQFSEQDIWYLTRAAQRTFKPRIETDYSRDLVARFFPALQLELERRHLW